MFSMTTCVSEGTEDHEIITDFFIQNKMLLYREAWQYLSVKEDVEDIVCETLVRIIAHMEKFRTLLPYERIQYSKAIVRNLSYIHLKRNSLLTMVPFEDIDTYLAVEESQLPENIVDQQIKLEQIRKVWGEIPVEERLLLEQKYVLDWSDKELAAVLSVQPQSVRMRLTRAKRKVIQLLREQGFQFSDWL